MTLNLSCVSIPRRVSRIFAGTNPRSCLFISSFWKKWNKNYWNMIVMWQHCVRIVATSCTCKQTNYIFDTAGTKAVLDHRQKFFKIPYCGKTFSIFYLLFLVYKYSIISCININNVIVVYPVKYYDIAPRFPHWFDIYQPGDVHNVGISHSWINISNYWNHLTHIDQSGIPFGSISIIV